MPSYQATPTESTVSHTASSRKAAMSSRGTQRGASEHILPYHTSSSASLSQAPPTNADSSASTVVDHDQGGVGGGKGEEPKPVVLNSVYINGTGWASQVLLLQLIRGGGRVCKLIKYAIINVFSLVVLW